MRKNPQDLNGFSPLELCDLLSEGPLVRFWVERERSPLGRLLRHHFKAEKIVRNLFAQSCEKELKQGKGLVFEFKKGIFLPHSSHLDVRAKVVDREQMLLPKLVDLADHHVPDHFFKDILRFYIIRKL